MTEFAMTSYLRKKVGDYITSGTVYTPPATIYLSQHTGDPTATGSRAFEISTSSTGYVRQILSGNLSVVDAVTGLQSLVNVINFSPALIDLGTVSYLGIDDALSGGNMLMFAALSTAQVCNAGSQFQLVAGQLTIQWQ